MFKRILVPTDGTATSMAAVDAAIGFAHGSGAQVLGLHVTPPRPLYSDGLGTLAAPETEDRAGEFLGYIERRAAQAGVAASVQARRADVPWEAIIDAARDRQCDLIVMGSRGRSPARALLLGSQTQAVLGHSAIPVMVIPKPEAAAG